MNRNSYPDDAELDRIRTWPREDGWPALMEYVRERWHWPEMFWQGTTRYQLATGGWSGNEDLIEAMMLNVLFRSACWVSSERGGRHCFEMRG